MRNDAPFPYFGGKSKIAEVVWAALGQPAHYIEPFFGSGAVLLARPAYQRGRHTETVCDKDGFIANVWRALQFAPDEVARWCDWPVNHADLAARKKELIKNEEKLLNNLVENPEWYDAKLAGYWIWAAGCWIGKGLMSINQRPHIGTAGSGVHGIGQRPHISDAGNGVHAARNTNIYAWFKNLSERLRYVRVVCGDWTRVCGGEWQTKLGIAGIFLDPPYGVTDRASDIYHHDSTEVAAEVMAWARERGANTTYRIVLAGYEEYQPLLAEGWTQHSWKAGGGYSTSSNKNRHRETLYFSPHCLKNTLF